MQWVYAYIMYACSIRLSSIVLDECLFHVTPYVVLC